MKKIILLLLCALLVTMPVSAEELQTNILPLLGEMKIMQGDTDGNLRLDDYVSRAEFAKIAITASKHKNTVALNLKISPFKDVTHQHWASPYIKLASDHKLVTGYPDSSFQPDNTVLYEEALNVFLKLLGYDDTDFGSSWPYGQVGLAINCGLTEGLEKSIGELMTRRDVAYLTYNLLNTEPKNSTAHYIETLNYKILEDVIILGTPLTDTSVGSGRVNTTSGNYRTSLTLEDAVGKKGDLILKNANEAVGFIPSNQYVEEYLVYQILDDDIVVSQNGTLKSLSVDKNLTVYNKSQTTSLKNSLASISIGDTLKIYKTMDMVTDYGVLSTDLLKGPVTATSKTVVQTDENTTFIRNGSQANGYELNDILYYSEKLNTVWAYSKKVSGVYESASPNRDNPTSVVISGTTYALEGAEAFYKLSSKGTVKLGDSVTVLLGRDGKIADVLSGTPDSVVGYLQATGKKTFQNGDGSEYSSNYVSLVTASGEVLEYPTSSDYSASKNKIVKLSFQNQKVKLNTLNTASSVSGTVDYDTKTIGNHRLAEEVSILDVSTIDKLETGSYVKIYPQRLDEMNLSASSVLYSEKNQAGEIDTLFLHNVTGDAHKYGIVTYASEYNERSNMRTYTYDIDGNTTTVNGSIFTSVSTGAPARFVFSGNTIDSITSLFKISSPVSQINDFSVVCNDTEYLMSDRVVVYQKNADYQYLKMAKDDLMEQQDSYTIHAYYDKSQSAGGRIRVLVAVKKPN